MWQDCSKVSLLVQMGKKLKHARQLAIAQHKERLKLQQKEQKQQGAPHQKPKQPPQLKHQTQQQQPKPKEGGDKEAPGSAAAKAATAQRSASGQSPQSSSPLSSGQPQGIAVDHSPRPEPAEPRAGQQAEGGGTEAEAAPRRAPTQSLYSVSDVILTIGDGKCAYTRAALRTYLSSGLRLGRPSGLKRVSTVCLCRELLFQCRAGEPPGQR